MNKNVKLSVFFEEKCTFKLNSQRAQTLLETISELGQPVKLENKFPSTLTLGKGTIKQI